MAPMTVKGTNALRLRPVFRFHDGVNGEADMKPVLAALLASLAVAPAAQAQYSFTSSDVRASSPRGAVISCLPAGTTATASMPGNGSTSGMGSVTIRLVNYMPGSIRVTIVPIVTNGGSPGHTSPSTAQELSGTIPGGGGSAQFTAPIWMWPPVTAIGFNVLSCSPT